MAIALETDPKYINIKATTTEGLGLIGEGRGHGRHVFGFIGTQPSPIESRYPRLMEYTATAIFVQQYFPIQSIALGGTTICVRWQEMTDVTVLSLFLEGDLLICHDDI